MMIPVLRGPRVLEDVEPIIQARSAVRKAAIVLVGFATGSNLVFLAAAGGLESSSRSGRTAER